MNPNAVIMLKTSVDDKSTEINVNSVQGFQNSWHWFKFSSL